MCIWTLLHMSPYLHHVQCSFANDPDLYSLGFLLWCTAYTERRAAKHVTCKKRLPIEPYFETAARFTMAQSAAELILEEMCPSLGGSRSAASCDQDQEAAASNSTVLNNNRSLLVHRLPAQHYINTVIKFIDEYERAVCNYRGCMCTCTRRRVRTNHTLYLS